MAAISDYLENALLDHSLKGTAYTQPTNIYLALFTTATTDAGGGTEVTGGAYARVSISASFAAAAAGTKSSNADINFAQATANWGTVTHVAVMDALTLGNMLWHGALTASKTINNGDVFKILSGSLDLSLD